MRLNGQMQRLLWTVRDVSKLIELAISHRLLLRLLLKPGLWRLKPRSKTTKK